MKKPIILKTYFIVFNILLFSISFSGIATSLPNIVLIILALLFPFCLHKEMLKEFNTPVILIYFVLVLYVSANIWFKGYLKSDMSQIGKLYLPLVLYILSFPIKRDFKFLQISLIFGVLSIVCISLISIIFYAQKQGEFSFTTGSIVNEILLLERVYIAFLCVISFVFSLHLLPFYKSIRRKLVIVNIIIVVGFVFIIAARMALISIIVITTYYVFRLLDKKRILYLISTGILFIVLFFLTNKNLQNRFFYSDHKKSFVENLQIWEPRMVIWPCIYEITTSEYFNSYSGIGSYKLAKQELLNCYDSAIKHPEKKKWFLLSKYNTHNQFLDFLLVSGFLGFLLFMAVFVVAIWKNKDSFMKVSLVIAFMLVSLVENYFHRQVGVYCFAVFFIFLRYNSSIETPKIKYDG